MIAQGISGILCLLYIAKKVPALYLHREDWEIDKNLAGWQLKIGLPMAFQYSITAIGTIVVQSCLNILGSTAAAGFAAASKIELRCAWYNDGDLLCTEYGGREIYENP